MGMKQSAVEIRCTFAGFDLVLPADDAATAAAALQVIQQFPRVLENRVLIAQAQTGDPTGTGTGGSDLPDLPSEFTRAARFQRGTLGMARTMNPHSANSQFFIMFEPAPSLDGQYTIVGEVVSGMEHVDAIKRGAGGNGMVSDPDRIVSFKPEAA